LYKLPQRDDHVSSIKRGATKEAYDMFDACNANFSIDGLPTDGPDPLLKHFWALCSSNTINSERRKF